MEPFRHLSRAGKRGKPDTKQLEAGIAKLRRAEGHACRAAPRACSTAFRLSEELGQLAYRVWYYPSLQYDEDQRDNAVNAKRQQVQILFARLAQAESWFNPELLTIPLETVRGWMDADANRFGSTGSRSRICTGSRSTCSTKSGEKLMSLASRLASSPNDAYWALSTADAKFPTITLVDRRAGHRLVRPVPRAARHAARTGRSRGGVPRAARDLSRDAEHLRDALQRRLPARLVPGARARLHEHARSGAPRRQHSRPRSSRT